MHQVFPVEPDLKGAHFSEEASQPTAARTAIGPENQRSIVWILLSLHEPIEDFFALGPLTWQHLAATDSAPQKNCWYQDSKFMCPKASDTFLFYILFN